jgi:hypothetical protein
MLMFEEEKAIEAKMGGGLIIKKTTIEGKILGK